MKRMAATLLAVTLVVPGVATATTDGPDSTPETTPPAITTPHEECPFQGDAEMSGTMDDAQHRNMHAVMESAHTDDMPSMMDDAQHRNMHAVMESAHTDDMPSMMDDAQHRNMHAVMESAHTDDMPSMMDDAQHRNTAMDSAHMGGAGGMMGGVGGTATPPGPGRGMMP